MCPDGSCTGAHEEGCLCLRLPWTGEAMLEEDTAFVLVALGFCVLVTSRCLVFMALRSLRNTRTTSTKA